MSGDGDNNFRSIRSNRKLAVFYRHGVVRVGLSIHDRANGIFAQVFAFFTGEFHILEFFHSAITFDKAFNSETKFGVAFAKHLRRIGNSQSNRLRSNREGLFQNAAKVTDTGNRHGSNASIDVFCIAYDIIRLCIQGVATFKEHDHIGCQRSAAINDFALGKGDFVESEVSLPVGLENLVARLVIGNLDRFRRAVYAGAAPASKHIPFLNRVIELERFSIFGEEHIGVGSRQSTAIEIVRNEERIVERVVNPGNAFFHPVLHVIDFALVSQAFFITCRIRMNLLAKNIPFHKVAFGGNRIIAGQGQEHALHRSIQSFLLFVPTCNHVMNKQGVFEHAGCPIAVLDIPSGHGSNLTIAIITESHVEIPNRAVMQHRIGRIVELVNGGEILCIVVAGNLVHEEPVDYGLFVEIFTPAIHGILEIVTVQGVFRRLHNSLHMFLDVFGHFVGILQSNRSFSLFRFKPEFSILPVIDFQDKATVEHIGFAILIYVHVFFSIDIFFRVIRNVLDINTTRTDGIPFAQNVITLIDAIPHHFYRVEGRIPFCIEDVFCQQGRIDVTQQRLVGVVCDDAPLFSIGKSEKRLLLVELDSVSLLVHLPGRVSATLDAFFFLAIFFFLEFILKGGAIIVDKFHISENVHILCYFLHRNFGVDVQHREPRVGHGRDIRGHGFFAGGRDAEVVADALLGKHVRAERAFVSPFDGLGIFRRAVGRPEPLVRDFLFPLLGGKGNRNRRVLLCNRNRSGLLGNG